jgi:hypothetical protein
MSTMQISQNFREFLQRVEGIDLKPIAYQLKQLHWSREQIEVAIARYLAFLFLTNQYPKIPLVPTVEIDQVWHCHILDTSKYAADCQTLFNRFIDHFPYFGVRGACDRQSQLRAYALTQALMRNHFGDRFANYALPADCEPLIRTTMAGCAASLELVVRPQVEISIAAVLAQFDR